MSLAGRRALDERYSRERKSLTVSRKKPIRAYSLMGKERSVAISNDYLSVRVFKLGNV